MRMRRASVRLFGQGGAWQCRSAAAYDTSSLTDSLLFRTMKMFILPIFICVASFGTGRSETLRGVSMGKGPSGTIQKAADFLLEAQMQAGQLEVLIANISHARITITAIEMSTTSRGTQKACRGACSACPCWRTESAVFA